MAQKLEEEVYDSNAGGWWSDAGDGIFRFVSNNARKSLSADKVTISYYLTKKADERYLHATNHAARIHPNGEKEWWVNGSLIKIERANGEIAFYRDSKLHSLNGPAVLNMNDSSKSKYFIDGKLFSADDWKSRVKEINAALGVTISEPKEEVKEEQSVPSEISKNKELGDMFVSSFKEAAKRNAVRSVVEGVVSGIEVASNSSDNENFKDLAEFLKKPIGQAVIKSAFGYSAEFIPQLKNNAVVGLLAEECRNQGMEDFQRDILMKAMEFILPAIMKSVNDLQNTPGFSELQEINSLEKVHEEVNEEIQEKVKVPAKRKAN